MKSYLYFQYITLVASIFLVFTINGNAQTNYYPIASNTDLSQTSQWTTSSNGVGGSNPSNFTANNQIFNITNYNGANNATPTIGANWTVSGSGSEIIVGDGTSTVNFTIPSSYKVTATLGNVTANAQLTISNSASLTSITWPSNVNSASTIDFLNLGSSSSIPILAASVNGYGNVIFDGTEYTNSGTNTFSFAGNLTLQNSGAGFVPGGSTKTSVNLTGSANQTITGNNYELHCYNFADTMKTGGNVTFATNSPITFLNTLWLKQTSSTNAFSDGGNTDTALNNLNMYGVSAGYNFTGTIVLTGTSGTQKITNNNNVPNPGATPAALNNLILNCDDKVSFITGTTAQNVTLKGNLLITSSGGNAVTLNTTSPTAGADTFYIKGNFTDKQTNTPVTFNGGTIYILNGSSVQTLQTSVSGGETFTSLTINNSSGVTLNSPFSVSGTFTLKNGILTTSSTNILTINSGGTSSVGSSTSYVSGPMAKTGNTSFTFPIGGGGGRYMPLGISAPATATNTITAQYTFSPPSNQFSLYSPLTNISSLEYWTLSETVPTNSVTVTLNWQNGNQSGIYKYNYSLQIADYNGTDWNDLGQNTLTGTYPGVGSITAFSSISGFSNLPITFGSTNYSNNPLPVTLSSFTANYINKSDLVLIDWTIASQLNNKEFVIEKTQDGINYTEVAVIQGAGTTPFGESYSAVDNTPAKGISYYRLKQIDMDGNATDFPPAPVFINTSLISTILLHPNPVASVASLSYISENSEPITIYVTDLTGRTLSSANYNQIHAGENNISINTNNLGNGIYFLSVITIQKTYCLKFLKETN